MSDVILGVIIRPLTVIVLLLSAAVLARVGGRFIRDGKIKSFLFTPSTQFRRPHLIIMAIVIIGFYVAMMIAVL